ncbi:hypothetical protein ACJIZ3_021254 [Penstemon smallii]|uniref:C3H1-type domain-containing protein n=1 Tax=Penstemon smallii TaxID=265156 RepID=A0ABD3SL72_9LAMI
MLGERNHGVPPWSVTVDDKSSSYVDDYSQFFKTDSLTAAALRRYFPSNIKDDNIDDVGGFHSVDTYSCDNFRMYEFKVRKCARERSHDWTDCPFAHPGEKARRRDPKKFYYLGTSCPDFRKGSCRKGDGCEFSHGVFECWLHPARYRTQPCKDGMNCTRRVCFFAHSPDQLRVLSPRAESTPVSTPNSVNEMVASLRRLQLIKMNSMPNFRGDSSGGGSSPRVKMSPPVFFSLPNTPTRPESRIRNFDVWDSAESEEEPIMERVESGRNLRAKMFEKLSKENPLDRVDPDSDANPDVGWVSNLVM